MPYEPTVLSPETAAAVEWPTLQRLLAGLAGTDLGAERLLALAPAGGDEELARRRRRYQEVSRLARDGRLVPSFEQPLADLLERLDTGRPPLGGADLVRLAAMVRAAGGAARRARQADPAHPDEACPELAAWAERLPDLSALAREIDQRLDRRGDVRDDASPELVALRSRIRGVRDRLYKQLGSFITEHGDAVGEDTIPMRGGRLMVVLDSGARGRVGGLVHGRSATGKSFYFEPLGVVEENNALQQASEDEEAERRRILAELLRAARQALPELELLAEWLAELDLQQAAVRFADLSEGRLAEVGPRHELVLAGARHPLLDPRLAALRRDVLGKAGHEGSGPGEAGADTHGGETSSRDAVSPDTVSRDTWGRDVVPLDLAFSAAERALVVTGPNAGGKTVALKTVGLLAVAAGCGLPVPVAAGSRLPRLARLVATVGDEQDLLTDRSTFSGRLLRLQEAWEAAGPDSLVLIDELGSGTDPEEGAALGVALLEGLLERGSLAVITTHLTALAAAALEMDGAGCAAMEFEPATGRPTFRLLPGPPGASEALALARRLGLDPAWLDRAEARLGSGHRDLQRLLTEVEQVRAELAMEHDRLAAEAADAEKLRRRLAATQEELAEERRQVGKRLKAELDDFRRRTLERLREEVERLRGEMEQGRRKGLASEAVERLFEEAPEVEEPEAAGAGGPLVPGARVRHRGLGWEGALQGIDRGRAEVSVRGKTLRCPAAELVALDAAAPPPAAPAATERRRNRGGVSYDLGAQLGGDGGGGGPEVPQELMLIGQRVEPALASLDDYLDRALLGTRPEVRVVHGHGSGRLRDAVREHLRRHPAVAGQRPGERNEGGDGATVVTLRSAS